MTYTYECILCRQSNLTCARFDRYGNLQCSRTMLFPLFTRVEISSMLKQCYSAPNFYHAKTLLLAIGTASRNQPI